MGKVSRFASLALAAGVALSMIVGTASAAQAQGSWFNSNNGGAYGGRGNWGQGSNWQGRKQGWASNGFAAGGGSCGNNNSGWNGGNQWRKKHRKHRRHNWQNGVTGYNGLGANGGLLPVTNLTGGAGFVPAMNYPASAYGNGGILGGTGVVGNGFIPNPAYGTPYANNYQPTSGLGSALGSLLGGLAPAQAQQVYGY